jgi:hypothetical protein
MICILAFILAIVAAVLLKLKLKFAQVVLAMCAATFTLVFIIFTSFFIIHLGLGSQYPESYRVERRLIDAVAFARNYEIANNTFPKKDEFNNWANRVYPNWSFRYIFYLSNGEETENWSQKAVGYRIGAFTGDETQYFYSIGASRYFSYDDKVNIFKL